MINFQKFQKIASYVLELQVKFIDAVAEISFFKVTFPIRVVVDLSASTLPTGAYT